MSKVIELERARLERLINKKYDLSLADQYLELMEEEMPPSWCTSELVSASRILIARALTKWIENEGVGELPEEINMLARWIILRGEDK